MKSVKTTLSLTLAMAFFIQPATTFAWERTATNSALVAAGAGTIGLGYMQLRMRDARIAVPAGKAAENLRAAMKRDQHLQFYIESRNQVQSTRGQIVAFTEKKNLASSASTKAQIEVKLTNLRSELQIQMQHRREIGSLIVDKISKEERLMSVSDVARRFNVREAELFDLTEQTSRRLRSPNMGSFLILGGVAIGLSGFVTHAVNDANLNEAFANMSDQDKDELMSVIDSQIIDPSDEALTELVK